MPAIGHGPGQDAAPPTSHSGRAVGNALWDACCSAKVASKRAPRSLVMFFVIRAPDRIAPAGLGAGRAGAHERAARHSRVAPRLIAVIVLASSVSRTDTVAQI